MAYTPEEMMNPTVENLRKAWLSQFWFAGPTEKYDAEEAIDDFLYPLVLIEENNNVSN